MNDGGLFNSRYGQWALDQPRNSVSVEQARDALALLVDCVNAGEVTYLDSQDSLISKKIREHHRIEIFEMNSNWTGTPQDWICPCCRRSKFQISRVGKKSQILAKSVVHHDHMGEALKEAFKHEFIKAGTVTEQIDGLKLVDHMKTAFSAYEEVLICEDCNNADTEAKKLGSTPKFFSFSIGQIRRFIKVENHMAHDILQEKVLAEWEASQPAYKLRMRIIAAVAKAAATDEHWYEPHPGNSEPVPVYWHTRDNYLIAKWIHSDSLMVSLGTSTKVSAPNLARWRQSTQNVGKTLPINFLALLRSDEVDAKRWDKIDDKWVCPICLRPKNETVYLKPEGDITFYVKDTGRNQYWNQFPQICNHCGTVLMSLKQEIVSHIGKFQDSYGFVKPSELAEIITPRPHSAHLVKSNEAAALIAAILGRYKNGPHRIELKGPAST
jgi:rubredoxin